MSNEEVSFDNELKKIATPIFIGLVITPFVIDGGFLYVFIANTIAIFGLVMSYKTKESIYIIITFLLLILASIALMIMGFIVSGSEGGQMVTGAIGLIIWLIQSIVKISKTSSD